MSRRWGCRSPMPGNESYLLAEQGALDGVKHFALWPLAQAAQSCFGDDRWPADLAAPQAWIEFDVADMALATQGLIDRGYRLLVANREEPGAKRYPFAQPGRVAGRRHLYALAALNAAPFAAVSAAGGLRTNSH